MATRALSDQVLQETKSALEACQGNVSAAAVMLGIPRTTVQSRKEALTLRAMSVGESPAPLSAEPQSPVVSLRLKQLEHALATERSLRLTEAVLRESVFGLSEQITHADLPDWVVAPDPGKSRPGVPTLMLSDLHHGEVVDPAQINGVNEFNMEISRLRLREVANTAIHLLRIISPNMDYPGIVVPLGGDMISGNIHDELMATNEFNTMPVVLDLYGELIQLIRFMADTFGHVFLPCVTGNHGRDTKKIWNKDRHATSFDWLLYNFLAKHFAKDSRITFLIPDGPDAYYRIYNHRYLLTHGDQFRGGDGVIGALGPIIRGDQKKRSRNMQIQMEYDTLLIGHWHQYIHLTRLIVNGSNKGYDEYAYNNNFPFESPQQALWLTHPTHGITFRMPVKVSHKAAQSQGVSWVSLPK